DQAAGDGGGVQVQLGEDLGDLLAVDDVVLPRVALLPGVRLPAELVGARDEREVQPLGVDVELLEEGRRKHGARELARAVVPGGSCCGRWHDSSGPWRQRAPAEPSRRPAPHAPPADVRASAWALSDGTREAGERFPPSGER